MILLQLAPRGYKTLNPLGRGVKKPLTDCCEKPLLSIGLDKSELQVMEDRELQRARRLLALRWPHSVCSSDYTA